MVNYLEMGANVLQDRLESFAGVEVTYRRGGRKYAPATFTLQAVPGRNPVDVVDQSGVVLRAQVQDFIVKIAAFRAKMPEPKYPVRGDEIEMTVANGYRVVFVVTGEDFSTSHYEPADSYGVAWRIHTKSDRASA